MIGHDLMDNFSCLPLDSLEFLHYNKSNKTEIEELENLWPCELRIYWKSPNVQGLVSVVHFLFNYATIIIIITGLLVNIFSLFVLNSPPISKCNISIYLRALAVSDIGALIFNVSVGVLRARSTVINNLYITHAWVCALHKIFLSVFFYYSSWLIVTFTFERLLMIRNPFKIHTWHNEKPAKFAVIVLAVAALALALIRSMTTPGFENDNMYGYVPCGRHDHIKISINMIPFMLINNIVPTILITTANISLLVHIRRSAQDQSKLNATNDQTNALMITRILIIISIVYVILYLPVGIVGCIELFLRKNEPPHENHTLHILWTKKMILFKWIRGLCFFLYLLNYVNNFFLYCLSGDTFRQTAKVCLSLYVQKICPCLTSKYCVSKRRTTQYINFIPSSSQKKHGSISSVNRLDTSINIISENCYHNVLVCNSVENICD